MKQIAPIRLGETPADDMPNMAKINNIVFPIPLTSPIFYLLINIIVIGTRVLIFQNVWRKQKNTFGKRLSCWKG